MMNAGAMFDKMSPRHGEVKRYNISDLPSADSKGIGSLSVKNTKKQKAKVDETQMVISIYKKNPSITRNEAYRESGLSKTKFNNIVGSIEFEEFHNDLKDKLQTRKDLDFLKIYSDAESRLHKIINSEDEHTANILSAIKLLTTTDYFIKKHEEAVARQGEGGDSVNKTAEVRTAIKKLMYAKKMSDVEFTLKNKDKSKD